MSARLGELKAAGAMVVRVDGYRAECVDECPWSGALRDEWSEAAADLAQHTLIIHVAPYVDDEGRWTDRR